MMWRTHMAVGANALWLVGATGNLDASILILLPVACVASILPDIDGFGRGAKIHHIGGGVLGVFAGAFHGKYFHHRGIMHSLPVALLLLIVLWIFTKNTVPMFAPVASLAYFSHSVVDGLNKGVGYLYPFSRRLIALVPRSLWSRVGGPVDQILFFIALGGVAVFFITYGLSLVPAGQSLIIGRNI